MHREILHMSWSFDGSSQLQATDIIQVIVHVAAWGHEGGTFVSRVLPTLIELAIADATRYYGVAAEECSALY